MKTAELSADQSDEVSVETSPSYVTSDDGVQPVAATDIAVVGRAVRLPGAQTVAQFWENLVTGTESIRPLSEPELRAAGVDPSLLQDSRYVRAAATLDGVDQFDAGFFGFSPREASIMDPQHRHFLEVTWEALEDAGHVPESFNGRIGVFAGSGMNAYMPYHLFTNPKLMAASGLFLIRHTGNDKDFLTTRVSYLFDLRGPSVNIQTACSTSLVAIHAACQSLISQECDMALAGGVTIEMPHGQGYLYQEGEILSDDGHCRAFDRNAKGTVFGSGAGVVVLRRLQDALADGDTIYAVVKASAINNDGARKVGYLAPSVDGQAEAIAEALNLSGVPAETISYIECHGTGTPVGDPIEVTALTQAFRSLTDRTQFCAIGSAKTNIGHLDTAAGVAGFVKVVEMLRHRTLVPNLHIREQNPEVDWASSPFFVSRSTTPWRSDGPLRASVNSLGVGGTNAHVVLEEGLPVAPGEPATEGALIVLSARSKASLDRASQRLADHLERNDDIDLADAAFTLAVGRRRFPERRAIAVASRAEAIAALRSGSRRWISGTFNDTQLPVAFLFPGGGAQYPGMAADLYRTEPVFKERVDTCLELLRVHEGLDLRPLMYPPAEDQERAARELQKPSFALPALLTIELAVADLLRSWGIVPAAMLGHSMGEYAAAHLAGVFTLRDVLSVVTCRGRLFETLPEGAMLSVPLPEHEVQPELTPGLSFAASNGPGLCLVSGEVAEIDALAARLASRGVEARRLAITVAAHSQMLDPILGKFEAYLRSLRLSPPTLPFVSNVTGTWITPEEARDPLYWVRHLRQPVRFAEGVATLTTGSSYGLVEVGPGRTLTSLVQSHPDIGPTQTVVQSLRHPQDPIGDREALLSAVGKLWIAGVTPSWPSLFGSARRRVSLPTYSFDHERYWIEPGDGFFLRPNTSTAIEKLADRSQWSYRPVWRRTARTAPVTGARNVLVFEDETGVGRELAMNLRAAGHTVDVVRPGNGFARIDQSTFTVRAGSNEDVAAVLRSLSDAGRSPAQIVHLGAVDECDDLTESSACNRYFHPLVAVAHALVEEEPVGGAEVVVVTNGASAVEAEVGPAFPFKALIQGHVRVLPKEMPAVSWRAVDVAPSLASPRSVAQSLTDEIGSLSRDAFVALRGVERFVEAYERWPLPATPGDWPLRERGVVLITGGLGGMSLALAARLAESRKARFVLLGRSGLPPREQWTDKLAALDPGDPIHTGIRGVQAIEAAGGEVLVLAADVADPAALARCFEEGERRFGRIDAVIHAAGVIDDAPLHGKERNRLEAVLRPKVAGATALAARLRGRDLDFFALFSSTSTVLGPAGQVDYVAGNAFLNAFGQRLAAEGLQTRVVQWGPWQEVGMAVAAAAPGVARGERVSHPLLQRRTRSENGTTHFAATLDVRSHWVLDEHRLRGASPVLPGTGFVEICRAAVVASQPAEFDGAVELSDIAFTTPLVISDDSPAFVETEIQQEGAGLAITVRGRTKRGPATVHATARARTVPAPAPARVDIAALENRCTVRSESFEAGRQALPQERLLSFGARWNVVRRVQFGSGEAVARLELSQRFAEDLSVYHLHPGLLDMATGCAFALIPARDEQVIVPLSYGRVRVSAALPQTLVSHIRLRSHTPEGVGILDVTLADERGLVVAEIEGYVVKAVDPAVLKGGRKAAAAASPLETWLQFGILPEEGFDMLGRLLAQPGEVQVLVSPTDLPQMLAQLETPDQPTPARKDHARAGGTEPAANAGSRDPVEERLAELWSELLGVDNVGPQDGFFDLGGHSLIAVRLFARIRRIWDVDLPLATLFAAPTLEELAAAVRERLGVPAVQAQVSDAAGVPSAPAPPRWSPLVIVRKGGQRTPFFCVHGAGGNLLNFREFAQRLSPDQPVFGLEARGVDGQLPAAESIEEMAALYVEAVRRQQPSGPYILGGYSGGGVVALEMAHSLIAAGEAVPHIVLLDTFHPGVREYVETSWRAYASGIARAMAEEGVLPHIRRRVRVAIDRRVVHAREERRLREILDRNEPVPHELRELHLSTMFLRALRAHTPRPYAGLVTLFRAEELAGSYLHVGPRLAWDEVVLPNLQVVPVPGGHHSLMQEPNVSVLASGLERILAGNAGSPARGTSLAANVNGLEPEDRKVLVGA
jgi:acyl transferase domain-containing protein/thioesterase domain-containing protein/acyl carrier protein